MSPTSISTELLSPLWLNSKSSSKLKEQRYCYKISQSGESKSWPKWSNKSNLLHLVNSLPKPQYVPPPTLVPLTLWNFPSPSTYINAKYLIKKIKRIKKEQKKKKSTFIMLTPDPILTRRYGYKSLWSICTNSLWPSLWVKASCRIAYIKFSFFFLKPN